MNNETVATFRNNDMPHVALLYADAVATGLEAMGSSSIGPAFADSCTEIREHMKAEHQVFQKNEHFNELWKSMGDPSGILYFYGFQAKDGARLKISVRQYFELLALSVARLSDTAKRDLDELCKVYVQSMSSTLRGELYKKPS